MPWAGKYDPDVEFPVAFGVREHPDNFLQRIPGATRCFAPLGKEPEPDAVLNYLHDAKPIVFNGEGINPNRLYERGLWTGWEYRQAKKMDWGGRLYFWLPNPDDPGIGL